MARSLNKLTDIRCKSVKDPGRLSDGGGLYLHVKPSGAKSWAFIWRKGGKRYEMGLGSYPTVKLAKARALANEYREAVAEGRNPITERRKETQPTFGECSDEMLDSIEDQWRSDKHKYQWRRTLETYAAPLRNMRVSEIGTDNVLEVLNPIWKTKPETALRLRGRIERVLDYAKAKGWRAGENPALWRGHLKNILPERQKLTRGHLPAMPYADVPSFFQSLAEKEAMAARALEFLILTATRTGEVLNLQWSELDLDAALWTLPAARTKAGREHRVPLSPETVHILSDLQKTKTSDFVFPGTRPNKPLSDMSMVMLMRRMKADDFTPHGFRSSFRDWAGDCTSFSRELAEQALAHAVGDATERAYRRADALEKRRKLMDAWARYCQREGNSKIIDLGSRNVSTDRH